MSSSRNIKQALDKAQNTLLMRFVALLMLVLLAVEVVVGAMFFYDLYRTEKKILNSMATEYQRILTFDSAERLIHVMTANPHRLIENNIRAYHVLEDSDEKPTFIAGDEGFKFNGDLELFVVDDKFWLKAFVFNPYMSLKIEGQGQEFWLVLDNQARYSIAFKQWLMTFFALALLVAATAWFTRRIIASAMFPLVTLGDSLDKLKQGKLEWVEQPLSAPQGLSVVSASVHEAVARLHHVTTTLNTTVDAIAHDIRTPLSRITLASQSALIEQNNPHKMHSALADCAEYAMQASNMLTALMKLNDELTGKREQQSVSTDVCQVIETVASWYEDVADDKNIALTTQLPPQLVIRSDPDKLTQILVNLVDNAIKYTESGGAVTIKAVQLDDQQVEIEVIDNGIGIENQYQQLVFERLYRVDTSRSNVQGYGLGLSLAAAMTDNLSGQIELSSQLGEGTIFTLRLPAGS